MDVVIADDGTPRHFETVQFAAHYCIGGAATVVGHISRQEDETHSFGKCLIDFIHDPGKVEVVLLACPGHVEIAKVNPADYACSVGWIGLKRPFRCERVHAESSLGVEWRRCVLVWFVRVCKRLGNCGPQQREGKCGDGSQREERDAVAEVLNQLSAEGVAESCADPDCSCKTALREIEAPCAARSVRNDEDRDYNEDRVRDAVEDLNCDQAARVVGQGCKELRGAEERQSRPSAVACGHEGWRTVQSPGRST